MITGFLEGRMNKDHILIMEYDGRVSRVLCRIISRLGLEPVPAGDYASFKALYDEHQPGCILLSLDSPRDGRSNVISPLAIIIVQMTVPNPAWKLNRAKAAKPYRVFQLLPGWRIETG